MPNSLIFFFCKTIILLLKQQSTIWWYVLPSFDTMLGNTVLFWVFFFFITQCDRCLVDKLWPKKPQDDYCFVEDGSFVKKIQTHISPLSVTCFVITFPVLNGNDLLLIDKSAGYAFLFVYFAWRKAYFSISEWSKMFCQCYPMCHFLNKAKDQNCFHQVSLLQSWLWFLQIYGCMLPYRNMQTFWRENVLRIF